MNTTSSIRSLDKLLEIYSIGIHTDLIDIVED